MEYQAESPENDAKTQFENWDADFVLDGSPSYSPASLKQSEQERSRLGQFDDQEEPSSSEADAEFMLRMTTLGNDGNDNPNDNLRPLSWFHRIRHNLDNEEDHMDSLTGISEHKDEEDDEDWNLDFDFEDNLPIVDRSSSQSHSYQTGSTMSPLPPPLTEVLSDDRTSLGSRSRSPRHRGHRGWGTQRNSRSRSWTRHRHNRSLLDYLEDSEHLSHHQLKPRIHEGSGMVQGVSKLAQVSVILDKICQPELVPKPLSTNPGEGDRDCFPGPSSPEEVWGVGGGSDAESMADSTREKSLSHYCQDLLGDQSPASTDHKFLAVMSGLEQSKALLAMKNFEDSYTKIQTSLYLLYKLNFDAIVEDTSGTRDPWLMQCAELDVEGMTDIEERCKCSNEYPRIAVEEEDLDLLVWLAGECLVQLTRLAELTVWRAPSIYVVALICGIWHMSAHCQSLSQCLQLRLLVLQTFVHIWMVSPIRWRRHIPEYVLDGFYRIIIIGQEAGLVSVVVEAASSLLLRAAWYSPLFGLAFQRHVDDSRSFESFEEEEEDSSDEGLQEDDSPRDSVTTMDTFEPDYSYDCLFLDPCCSTPSVNTSSLPFEGDYASTETFAVFLREHLPGFDDYRHPVAPGSMVDYGSYAHAVGIFALALHDSLTNHGSEMFIETELDDSQKSLKGLDMQAETLVCQSLLVLSEYTGPALGMSRYVPYRATTNSPHRTGKDPKEAYGRRRDSFQELGEGDQMHASLSTPEDFPALCSCLGYALLRMMAKLLRPTSHYALLALEVCVIILEKMGLVAEKERLQRELAMACARAKDVPRATRHCQKVLENLLGAETPDWHQVVLITDILVSFHVEAGVIKESKKLLGKTLSCLEKYRTALQDDRIEVVDLETCIIPLHLRMGQLYLAAGQAAQAIKKFNGLLGLIEETECASYTTSMAKRVIVLSWLAKACLENRDIGGCKWALDQIVVQRREHSSLTGSKRKSNPETVRHHRSPLSMGLGGMVFTGRNSSCSWWLGTLGGSSQVVRADQACLPAFCTSVQNIDLGELGARNLYHEKKYVEALNELAPTILSVEGEVAEQAAKSESKEGNIELGRLYYLRGKIQLAIAQSSSEIHYPFHVGKSIKNVDQQEDYTPQTWRSGFDFSKPFSDQRTTRASSTSNCTRGKSASKLTEKLHSPTYRGSQVPLVPPSNNRNKSAGWIKRPHIDSTKGTLQRHYRHYRCPEDVLADTIRWFQRAWKCYREADDIFLEAKAADALARTHLQPLFVPVQMFGASLHIAEMLPSRSSLTKSKRPGRRRTRIKDSYMDTSGTSSPYMKSSGREDSNESDGEDRSGFMKGNKTLTLVPPDVGNSPRNVQRRGAAGSGTEDVTSFRAASQKMPSFISEDDSSPRETGCSGTPSETTVIAPPPFLTEAQMHTEPPPTKKSKHSPSALKRRKVSLDDAEAVARHALKLSLEVCDPLLVIQCHLNMAEALVLKGDMLEGISSWWEARDLFLQLFVDGASIPILRLAPKRVIEKIRSLVSRMVRFLMALRKRPLTNINLLLLDLFVLLEHDIARIQEINDDTETADDGEKDEQTDSYLQVPPVKDPLFMFKRRTDRRASSVQRDLVRQRGIFRPTHHRGGRGSDVESSSSDLDNSTEDKMLYQISEKQNGLVSPRSREMARASLHNCGELPKLELQEMERTFRRDGGIASRPLSRERPRPHKRGGSLEFLSTARQERDATPERRQNLRRGTESGHQRSVSSSGVDLRSPAYSSRFGSPPRHRRTNSSGRKGGTPTKSHHIHAHSHRRSTSRGRRKGSTGLSRWGSSLDFTMKLDPATIDSQVVRKGWQGLFWVRSNIAQYQAGRLDSKELFLRNRQALKNINRYMTCLRQHNSQMTPVEATYDEIINKADMDLIASDITDSEALSERLRRSVYVLQIDDLIIFYCPRTGSTHAQRFGGRDEAVYKRSNDYELKRREGSSLKKERFNREEKTSPPDSDSDPTEFQPATDNHTYMSEANLVLLQDLAMAQAEDQLQGGPIARERAFKMLRDEAFPPVQGFFEEVLASANLPSPGQPLPKTAPGLPQRDVAEVVESPMVLTKNKDSPGSPSRSKNAKPSPKKSMSTHIPPMGHTDGPKSHPRLSPRSKSHLGLHQNLSGPLISQLKDSRMTTSWPGSETLGIFRRPTMPTMTVRIDKESRDKNIRNLFGLLKDEEVVCSEEVPVPLVLVCSRSVRAIPWEIIAPANASVVRSLSLLNQVQAADKQGGIGERCTGIPFFYTTAWNGSANMVRLSQWERNRIWTSAALKDLSPSKSAKMVPSINAPEKEASLVEYYGVDVEPKGSLPQVAHKVEMGSLDPTHQKEMANLRRRARRWPSHSSLLPFGQANWGPFSKRQSAQIKVIDASQLNKLSDIIAPLEKALTEKPCFPILIFSFSDLYQFSQIILSIVASYPRISVLFVPGAFTGTVTQELIDHIKRRVQNTILQTKGIIQGVTENPQQHCSPYIFLSLVIQKIQQSNKIPIVTFNM